jgi:hypothetical protein
MTPTDEARFIELWQQGLETVAIAQRLGIPPGTARSRAYTLQQQGKIQPRPRGGRRTPARTLGDGTPAAHPSTPRAAVTGHTTPPPALQQLATPLTPPKKTRIWEWLLGKS